MTLKNYLALMIVLILILLIPLTFNDRMQMKSEQSIITSRVYPGENESFEKYHTKNFQNMNKVKAFIYKFFPKSTSITSIVTINNSMKISFASFDGYFAYEGEVELELQEDYAFHLGGFSIKYEMIFSTYLSKLYSLDNSLIIKQNETMNNELENFIEYVGNNIGSLSNQP